VARLAELSNIIGIKDATGDATRPQRLRTMVGPDFRLLTGDDATAPAFLAQGGDGCISVVSNIAPGLCRNLFLASRQGQIATAQRWGAPIAKLTAALFRESSPAPLKYALSLLGLMTPRVRLPLVEVTEPTQVDVAAAMTVVCENYGDYVVGTMPGQRLRTAAS
jgi:4-hydroxy-tetrahydrodipicolinate synthase